MAFHVPESSRLRSGVMGSDGNNGNNGAFMVPSVIAGRKLLIIAADERDWDRERLPGEPWEHVSVHVVNGSKRYTPTWDEMCQVKDIFWDAEDTVIQFHPAKANYKNLHPYTLHLWRPVKTPLPLPPIEAV